MEIIDLSLHEFMTLSEDEWQKEYFSFETGGYVATHVLKAKDDSRPGIVAERNACLELAKMGKHILRLPDNVLKLIDVIIIDNRSYRSLLKFKGGCFEAKGLSRCLF